MKPDIKKFFKSKDDLRNAHIENPDLMSYAYALEDYIDKIERKAKKGKRKK